MRYVLAVALAVAVIATTLAIAAHRTGPAPTPDPIACLRAHAELGGLDCEIRARPLSPRVPRSKRTSDR